MTFQIHPTGHITFKRRRCGVALFGNRQVKFLVRCPSGMQEVARSVREVFGPHDFGAAGYENYLALNLAAAYLESEARQFIADDLSRKSAAPHHRDSRLVSAIYKSGSVKV